MQLGYFIIVQTVKNIVAARSHVSQLICLVCTGVHKNINIFAIDKHILDNVR